MGQYQDNVQNSWIHELAKAEVHPDAERILQLGRSFDPQQLVEESTIEFLLALREQFNDYAKAFNGYSEGGSKFQEAKIYSTAGTPADFMVFRSQVKLVVCNSAHGVIQFAFTHHVRGTLAVDGVQMTAQGAATGSASQGGLPQAQELVAQVGPFRDVHWTYQGERVTPDQVAKYYFAEFIRATRDSKKSKTTNQLLLDQIRTLLQERGLEL